MRFTIINASIKGKKGKDAWKKMKGRKYIGTLMRLRRVNK